MGGPGEFDGAGDAVNVPARLADRHVLMARQLVGERRDLGISPLGQLFDDQLPGGSLHGSHALVRLQGPHFRLLLGFRRVDGMRAVLGVVEVLGQSEPGARCVCAQRGQKARARTGSGGEQRGVEGVERGAGEGESVGLARAGGVEELDDVPPAQPGLPTAPVVGPVAFDSLGPVVEHGEGAPAQRLGVSALGSGEDEGQP